MKSAFILLIGLVIGAVGVIGGYFYFSTRTAGDDLVTITFTEAEIQEKIGGKFPQEKRIAEIFPTIIQEPQIKFLGESNRVQISCLATISVPLFKDYDIMGIFTSSIRYEKEDQTLRTSEITVEKLDMGKFPQIYNEAVRLALTAAARKFLADHIVHTIKKEDYKGQMAEMFLQDIKVKEGKLEVILGL